MDQIIPDHRFSKPAQSATLPPLRGDCCLPLLAEYARMPPGARAILCCAGLSFFETSQAIAERSLPSPPLLQSACLGRAWKPVLSSFRKEKRPASAPGVRWITEPGKWVRQAWRIKGEIFHSHQILTCSPDRHTYNEEWVYKRERIRRYIQV